MSKTLKTLYTKALRTGKSNLNGRKREYGYIGDLESKYAMKYNQETGDLKLYHWGTKILTIGSLKASSPILKYFYGQSKSDRDAIVFVFQELTLPYTASYKPSTDTFSVTADFGTGKIETKSI